MASETLAKIDRAYDVVSALCEGKREWFMSLPARPDHDPDLIIGDALLAASNEISRLTRELQALRRIVVDLHWMARRYVDGRTSYATRLFNDHTRALVALGVELNRTSDGTNWARDGMGRAYDGLSEEEAAQGQRAPEWLHDQDVERLRHELEAARELLRELAGGDEAGLVWDRGWRCVYCDSSALYVVSHDGECPIERARRALVADTEVSDGEHV